MEYIDNFLDKNYFDSLVTTFADRCNKKRPDFPWFFQSDIEGIKNSGGKNQLFYMTHAIYDNNEPNSNYYETILPLLDKLGIKCLIRAKTNLYPRTETLYEHQMHTDYTFIHSGAILSLNTCDGYTKLKDGTKIDSVANRLLLFDPSKEHCSTTTTNDFARFNININYIQEQYV